MTQYNSLNVILSNPQLGKLKLGTKADTEVALNLSSNMIGATNGKNNFALKLLLTDTQVSRLRNAFANNSSANIKWS